MFTGIIETIGRIEKIEQENANYSFWVSSVLYNELKPDQSLSHNGVCLTVEEIQGQWHKVTAIRETLDKTNLSAWQSGTIVNLERCMKINGRLDGHIVQGHVDATAKCIATAEKDGSWEFQFEIDKKFSTLIIEKGSITLNGISLTIFNISESAFTVAIIPYTYEHTNMSQLKINNTVNIEFDLIGKYVNRINLLKQ
ncbi:MAG: riboflavin synthase [Ferruginibacter sp.]